MTASSGLHNVPAVLKTVAHLIAEAEQTLRIRALGPVEEAIWDLVHSQRVTEERRRDLTKQVVANLVGSPDLIREKVAGLAAIGGDHACALMFPADSIAELEEQVQWFAETVVGPT